MARQFTSSDFEEFRSFCDEFRAESDRAAVILGAARLDQMLYQVLQRFLVPVAGNRDDLLDSDAPLSTFSSRINAVHRLGLITPEFARALHLVRKVRNSFAHEITTGSLEAGTHRDRIREIIMPFAGHTGFGEVRKHFFNDTDELGVNFRCALAIMSVRLLGLYDHLTPIEVQALPLTYPDVVADSETVDDNAEPTAEHPPRVTARARRRARNGSGHAGSGAPDV